MPGVLAIFSILVPVSIPVLVFSAFLLENPFGITSILFSSYNAEARCLKALKAFKTTFEAEDRESWIEKLA